MGIQIAPIYSRMDLKGSRTGFVGLEDNFSSEKA